jgi:DNA replication protein DnaC
LDDWGLSTLTEPEQRDLLEILEDRHQLASTIVTSQVPVEQWCEIIGNPTLADAILDRLVHNAHRLPMTGESMRKLSAKNASLTTRQRPESKSPSATHLPLTIARNARS